MEEIRTIYEESHQIYGAPKIAAKMRQKGDKISGRTVGKYMREIGIRACYRKHFVSMPCKLFKSTLPIQAETAKSPKNPFSGNYYSINLLHSDTYFSFQRHSFFLFLSQFTSFSGANPPAVLCLHQFRTKKSVYLSHQTQVLSQYALFSFYNYPLNYKIGDYLFPYR